MDVHLLWLNETNSFPLSLSPFDVFEQNTLPVPGQGLALEQGLAHGDIEVDWQQALGHSVSRGRSGSPEAELEQLETEQLEKTECKDASIDIFRNRTSKHSRLEQSSCTITSDIIGNHRQGQQSNLCQVATWVGPRSGTLMMAGGSWIGTFSTCVITCAGGAGIGTGTCTGTAFVLVMVW